MAFREPIRSMHVSTYARNTVTAAAVECHGRRDEMEDEHAVSVDKFLLKAAVFDGHTGGATSLACKERLLPLLKKMDPDDLKQQFCKFDLSLRDKAGPSGSTAVVALIDVHTGAGLVAYVGDSRAILLHDDGSFLSLTKDHKPDVDTERERIEAAGSRVYSERIDGKLALSRAFGDFVFKTADLPAASQAVSPVPDVIEFKLGPTDTLFLGCDGFFEQQDNQRVAEIIKQGMEKYRKPEDVLISLIKSSIRSGSCDNHTGILLGACWAGKSATPVCKRKFIPSPLRSVRCQTTVSLWRRDAIKGGGSLLELDERLEASSWDEEKGCYAPMVCPECLKDTEIDEFVRCKQCWYKGVCAGCLNSAVGICSHGGILSACRGCTNKEEHKVLGSCCSCGSETWACTTCCGTGKLQKCSSCDRAVCEACAGDQLLKCTGTLCILDPVCRACQSAGTTSECPACAQAICSLHPELHRGVCTAVVPSGDGGKKKRKRAESSPERPLLD